MQILYILYISYCNISRVIFFIYYTLYTLIYKKCLELPNDSNIQSGPVACVCVHAI